MSGLTVTDLHAHHGRNDVLRGVDLTVKDGELACVLGPSGCGKSTLLRIVAGFHPATTGTVTVGDRVLDDGRRRERAEKRRIGYVPQDGALFPHLTAAANIGFGLPRAERAARVPELLDLVGLAGLGDRHPHQLSGGQQQRVALARALAPRPDLLLLDEPFSALDAALRAELRTEVAAALRRAGATAVLVTHDVDEALAFADLVAVMRDGRITQSGTPDDLFHRPTDAHVARALGEANLLPAALNGDEATTPLGTLLLARPTGRDDAGTVMLRPRQLRLLTRADTDSWTHTLRATVAATQFRGHDHRVEVTPAADGLDHPLIAYTDTAPPPVGTSVHVVATGPVHALPAAGAATTAPTGDLARHQAR
ncbi:ABC transporter ATP-binding protein [Streptacidiphilus pinicola]|uniref:ABC-type quaternary amine transporter n=1 Tax=Streptacidiphilus pinicola TaxID=2219663 RepID=A0A2X0JFQ1_9ACTN|nr:ABC transporter ATP-binding protein [Streptacidiphilus pinicola]RAG86438.1 ABC transporter ATP-binding protein [Streptacidiphilus pinicola]